MEGEIRRLDNKITDHLKLKNKQRNELLELQTTAYSSEKTSE
jgi:hypothetical protein